MILLRGRQEGQSGKKQMGPREEREKRPCDAERKTAFTREKARERAPPSGLQREPALRTPLPQGDGFGTSTARTAR